ncbi:MAG: ImmA/IrrE family metallo-endopeptidase [Bacteroidetes bacterium]|nr:MAG: ImmA/IrrE family metallo-endopeptidase [Bacteroidota bacterium]
MSNKSRHLRFEIEKKALGFRIENGYSSTEPIQLDSLLIKQNVITIFKPLSGSLAGMAIKAPNGLKFMMINQNHNLGKQHFTIGHELYHLFIQENFTSQRCITGLFDKQIDIEEKKADLFSACLLLPESGIKQLIPDKEFANKKSLTVQTLFKIQHFYKVSMKATIFRLYELELIDDSYFKDYETGIKSTAHRLGFNISLYESGNFNKMIGDYGIVANQLFQNEKISEAHYYELLHAINIDPLKILQSENE